MQVIAIAIGKYQRVKGGVKCKDRVCGFVLGLIIIFIETSWLSGVEVLFLLCSKSHLQHAQSIFCIKSTAF